MLNRRITARTQIESERKPASPCTACRCPDGLNRTRQPETNFYFRVSNLEMRGVDVANIWPSSGVGVQHVRTSQTSEQQQPTGEHVIAEFSQSSTDLIGTADFEDTHVGVAEHTCLFDGIEDGLQFALSSLAYSWSQNGKLPPSGSPIGM